MIDSTTTNEATPTVTLHAGHALNVLKKIPTGTVHCCVTSPPYWGLRDYQTENKIWDDDLGCIHTWIRANIRDSRAGSFCILFGAWLGSLGLEPTPDLYIKHIVQIFREVSRVLKPEGTLWLVLGDSYAGPSPAAGMKRKDLVGIPWQIAFALRADGWYLRTDIVWHKRNPILENVRELST